MAVEEYEGQSEQPGALSGFFAEYGRDRILSLKPKSWRVFFEAITPRFESPSAIEVRVIWERNFRTKAFTIGEAKEDLGSIPISMAIHRADADWLGESMERNGTTPEEGKLKPRPMIGRLHYWEKQDSGDGVVCDKTGSVTGWIALGPENYARVLEMLTREGEPEISLGITVKMPIDNGGLWDGKEELDIVEAKVVLFHGPQDDETEREADQFDASPAPPPPEQLELVRQQGQLLVAFQKLRLPLWVIAGAVIVAAFWR